MNLCINMLNAGILLVYVHFINQDNYHYKAFQTLYTNLTHCMWLQILNLHISKWWTYLFKNRYIIGHDAGNWLKVDSRTGEIKFSREFDKKSKYITNGLYTAEILAVDGKKFHFQYFSKIIITLNIYYSNVDMRLTQIKYVILQDL